MSIRPFRLVDLPLPAKVTLTAFLALIGSGYLVSALNIFEHHHEADLEPGLTLDDLRRVYHRADACANTSNQAVSRRCGP